MEAQTNQSPETQWGELLKLKRGRFISVVDRIRQDCELVEVTETELTCNHDFGRVNRNIVFARDAIREVRLERADKNHMILGVIAGSVAGGLLGYFATLPAKDPETHGYASTYGIPLGGFVGGVIGRQHHRHGPVVYSAVARAQSKITNRTSVRRAISSIEHPPYSAWIRAAGGLPRLDLRRGVTVSSVPMVWTM